DPNPANNTNTATTSVTFSADLVVSVGVLPASLHSGTMATFPIAVEDLGPDPATDVSLTTAVPAGTTFVSFVAPGVWTVHAPAVGGTGKITATAPNLYIGITGFTQLSLTVRIDLTVPGGTVITDSATVSSATTDPRPTNNTSANHFVVIAASAALMLSII